MADDEQRPEAAITASTPASTPAEAGPRPGDEDLSAGGTPAAAAEIAGLEFQLATEVAYHTGREAWFGGLQRLTLFINVALGAGLLADYIDVKLAGFLVALASTLDVTFDFAGQARRHRDLRGRFSALAEEIADRRCDPLGVRRSMLRLNADAPPSYRAAEAIAYNQALAGLGRDKDYRLVVPIIQRLLRHCWPFGGTSYESIKDRRARMAAGEAGPPPADGA